MNILHLTDFHVTPPGQYAHGIDTCAAFTRLMARISGAVAPGAEPDLLVITGDIADAGEAEAYAYVAAGLDQLGYPYVIIPGNHDRRASFRDAFRAASLCGQNADSHLAMARTISGPWGAVRVLALDSLVEGASYGAIGAEQLAWIAAELTQYADAPVLIALHHPPFLTGIPAMDAIRLIEGADALERLLAAHGRVIGVLCGHVHRGITGRFAGAPCLSAPSSAWRFELDFRAPRDYRVANAAAHVLLHRYAGGVLTSFTIDEPAGPLR